MFYFIVTTVLEWDSCISCTPSHAVRRKEVFNSIVGFTEHAVPLCGGRLWLLSWLGSRVYTGGLISFCHVNIAIDAQIRSQHYSMFLKSLNKLLASESTRTAIPKQLKLTVFFFSPHTEYLQNIFQLHGFFSELIALNSDCICIFFLSL